MLVGGRLENLDEQRFRRRVRPMSDLRELAEPSGATGADVWGTVRSPGVHATPIGPWNHSAKRPMGCRASSAC